MASTLKVDMEETDEYRTRLGQAAADRIPRGACPGQL